MDKSFHYMIMVNQSLFQKKVLDALSPYKLTAGQPKVLDYLGKHNGCIQKSIATGCQIEPATLTGILSRMEEKKLIIRQIKDGNKRSLYVYLTDEGKRLQEIVNDTFEKVENAFCRLVDQNSNQVIASYKLSSQGAHTGLIIAKIYRHNGAWKMHAIGENVHGRTFQDIVPHVLPYV